jgi:hypothetical protein
VLGLEHNTDKCSPQRNLRPRPSARPLGADRGPSSSASSARSGRWVITKPEERRARPIAFVRALPCHGWIGDMARCPGRKHNASSRAMASRVGTRTAICPPRAEAQSPPGHRCLQAALVGTCMECQVRGGGVVGVVVVVAVRRVLLPAPACAGWRVLARWLQPPQLSRVPRPPRQRTLRCRLRAWLRTAAQRLDDVAVACTRCGSTVDSTMRCAAAGGHSVVASVEADEAAQHGACARPPKCGETSCRCRRALR